MATGRGPRDGPGGFADRYLAALRAHVKPAAEPRPGPARRLGLYACRLGIETLALARIHDAALAALATPGAGGARSGRSRAARAATFFAETLGPIEASHRPALEAPANGNGPGRPPDRGGIELASAQGRLTRETDRRRVAQEALATSKSERRVLLKRGAVERASARGRLTRETDRRQVAQEALATSESEHRILLKRGAVERASARGRLTRETDRRQVVQEALTASEGEHRVLLKRSDSMEEELRQLSRRLLTSHEEERKRISRELHDTLGQMLTAVNVGLASLQATARIDSREFRGSVARTQRLVRKSMRTVHLFARNLRPTLLDDLGLVPALHACAQEFGKANGIRVKVSALEEPSQIDGDRRTALFRVAQEALVNVGRHARARKVRVTLLGTPAGVRLEVWNDGTPFDVERTNNSRTNRRLGLLCMRERMEMVGGTLSIRSSKASGTTVQADVPLREPVGA
jgi:signal transduction histidine kinase